MSEIAWAAGLFEGQGTISDRRLQLSMANEESVRRFGAAIKVGKVYGPYGPYASSFGKVPIWLWTVYRPAHVRAVVESLRPFLTPSFTARLGS